MLVQLPHKTLHNQTCIATNYIKSHVTTRSNAKPYTLQVPWQVALPLLPKVEAELQRMETLGVISKSEEPTVGVPP